MSHQPHCFLTQTNAASATIVGGNFTNNAAILDSGSLHAEGTELLRLSAIDFVNSTVTEGGSASAALSQVYKCRRAGHVCKCRCGPTLSLATLAHDILTAGFGGAILLSAVANATLSDCTFTRCSAARSKGQGLLLHDTLLHMFAALRAHAVVAHMLLAEHEPPTVPRWRRRCAIRHWHRLGSQHQLLPVCKWQCSGQCWRCVCPRVGPLVLCRCTRSWFVQLCCAASLCTANSVRCCCRIGALTVANSNFTSNVATGDGGGLYLSDNLRQTISGSTFTANSADSESNACPR